MNDRPNIDERLQAIAESLELLVHESQEMRRRQEEIRQRQEELDRREHQGRMALLTGIRAYLEALGENGNEEKEG